MARGDQLAEDFGDELELEGATETIPAKVDLRAKAKPKRGKADFDPVAAAEQAMRQLGPRFDDWMETKVGVLLDAWRTVEAGDFDEVGRDLVFRAAHDLKGESATFGYPAAGEVAASLCLLLDGVPSAAFVPPVLVSQHVQAIRAIVAESKREAEGDVARRLADRLRDVTEEYVARF